MSMNEAGEEKPLLLLEGMLRGTIKQKKRQIHNSQDNNMMYIENLWTEIRTIQWILVQILTNLKSRRK